MRVCQLSHVENTYSFLAPLLLALRERGDEVVIACNLEHGGALVRRCVGTGFDMHRVPAARRLGLRQVSVDVLRLAAYLRRERFDVLHVHGPLVSVQARVAAALARVPVVVYEAHGFYFHDGTPPLVRRPLVRLERFLCRWLTDYVVTVSAEDHELATRHGFTRWPDRLVHVPGVGIDTERFHPASTPAEQVARRQLRSALGVAEGDVVVVFVGRLVREKGVLDLLAAFDDAAGAHPGAHLWIVGDALANERDRSTADEVRRRVAESARPDRVKLLGRRDDVAEVLRAADVLALPSYREGMPVSLLEGMSSGLPVVASAVRGCREAVVDGRSGWVVPPRDHDALARALQDLLGSPHERRRVGAAARQRVLQSYSVQQAVAPLLALYDVIGQEVARPGRSAACPA